MKKVVVIPIVVGALGTIPHKKINRCLTDINRYLTDPNKLLFFNIGIG